MGVLDWFKKRFKDEGKHYLYVPIPAHHVRYTDGREPEAIAVKAGHHYFRVWLTEMFLKNDREWFATWHPAVHSAVALEYGGKEKLISKIAGPSRLKDLDPDHLDRVIQLNHDLTPLLPFNGGKVGLTAGMLAMKGRDDVKSFIKVLGTFSDVLMVPQLSAVVKVAEPLANGISEMVDATDGELTVGVEQTLTSEGGGAEAELESGYVAVVLAEEGERIGDVPIKKEHFWVKEDQLHFGTSIEESEHLKGRHYMLLRIEARTERDDFDSLDEIQVPYGKAIESLQKQRPEEARTYLRAAIAAAFTSPNLTKIVDRRRVVTVLRERYAEAAEAFGAGAFAHVDTQISGVMQNAPSFAEAAAKPEMTETEALAGLEE